MGKRRTNRIINPKFGEDNNIDLSGVNFNEVVSLGLPLFSFFDNKASADNLLSQGVDVEFEDVEFITPAVRSARRPNFTVSSRPGTGSSLAEREAGLRFSEAQADAREQQFEAFNDQFIQNQIRQNTAILNQARSNNQRFRNIEESINTQTRVGQIGSLQNQANASLEAFFQNLISSGNQRAIGNAQTDASIVRDLISSGSLSSDEISKLLENSRSKRFNRRRKNILEGVK